MEIYSVPLGLYEANCYLVKDSVTGRNIIIDPGYYDEKLTNFLADHGVTEIDYILLTHGHMDHVCGASFVRENYGGKIVIGTQDAGLLKVNPFCKDVYEYAAQFRACDADIIADENFTLDFGKHKITVFHAEGHSMGGRCYIFDDEIMFCGDVLFKNSFGRYDFVENGIYYTVRTLRRILQLEKNYVIYTGHGESTTLDEEKKNNPALRQKP